MEGVRFEIQFVFLRLLILFFSWEPLEEKPLPGQWEYFGNTSSPTPP
jgi:hypothetical protein